MKWLTDLVKAFLAWVSWRKVGIWLLIGVVSGGVYLKRDWIKDRLASLTASKPAPEEGIPAYVSQARNLLDKIEAKATQDQGLRDKLQKLLDAERKRAELEKQLNEAEKEVAEALKDIPPDVK